MGRLRIPMLILLLLIPAVSHGYEGGDTGTYRILDYQVNLTPHDDGSATIDYYQKWQVTGGDVWWITIGAPDSDYSIDSYGANAVSAESADSGDWTGFRLGLDRDYQTGETFEVKCTITDRQLICAYDDGSRFEFTPGWYDRAATDVLQISFKCPAAVDAVTAEPEPTSSSNGVLIWRRESLGPGERYSISVRLPKDAIPNAQPAQEANDSHSSGGSGDDMGFWGLLVAFGIIIGFVAWYNRLTGGKQYTGGKIGGGGGGYGGGYHCACACACAGCACACACAGGGGAGCSRKSKHICPHCRKPLTAGRPEH